MSQQKKFISKKSRALSDCNLQHHQPHQLQLGHSIASMTSVALTLDRFVRSLSGRQGRNARQRHARQWAVFHMKNKLCGQIEVQIRKYCVLMCFVKYQYICFSRCSITFYVAMQTAQSQLCTTAAPPSLQGNAEGGSCNACNAYHSEQKAQGCHGSWESASVS